MVNNSPPNAKDADLIPGSGRSPGKRNKASLVAQLAKNLPAMQAIVGTDPGSIPELGRSPGEGIGYLLQYSWSSLLVQLVNNLPAIRETWFWSMGWENSMEKDMETHSSILVWRTPLNRRAWQATVHEVTELHMTEWLTMAHSNPLQYSCLGNPTDRGAWRAAVHGVAKELQKTEYLWIPYHRLKIRKF